MFKMYDNMLTYRSIEIEMKDKINIFNTVQYVLHVLSAIYLLDKHQDLFYVTAL
jgi:hypothetical protein